MKKLLTVGLAVMVAGAAFAAQKALTTPASNVTLEKVNNTVTPDQVTTRNPLFGIDKNSGSEVVVDGDGDNPLLSRTPVMPQLTPVEQVQYLKKMDLPIPQDLLDLVESQYPDIPNVQWTREGDECSDPIMIDALPYSTTGSTDDNSDTYGNSSPDEWFQLTVDAAGLLTVSLCESAYDTYLRLLADDCETQVAYNDDSCGLQSELTTFVDPGTYNICIEGYGSDSGDYVLNVTFEEENPEEGDSCGDAFVVDSLPFETTGTTADNIDTYGNAAPDEWYAFTAEDEGDYVVSLCGSSYDTYLWLLADDCATVVSNNDDSCGLQSEITAHLTPATYVVGVDGFSSSSGDFVLDIHMIDCGDVVCDGTPEGDDTANDGCNLDVPSFGTIECGETICGDVWSDESLRDLDWYAFDMAEASELDLYAEIDYFDAVIFLISDPAGDCNFEILASADNNGYCEDEEINTIVGPGHYYAVIAHNAWDGLGGNYAFTMTCTPWEADEGEFCDDPFMIDSFPFSGSGDLTDNINDFGTAGPDEWFQLETTEDGYLTISTCGSDFDTYLYLVLDDCATAIYENDNDPDCSPASLIYAFVTPGVYNICVDGAYGDAGNYVLDVAFEPGDIEEGDGCSDPYMVDLPYNGSETTVDNTNTYGNDAPDEWYQFSTDHSGDFVISLCGSEYDTYLWLLADDCATVVSANDDSCGLQSEIMATLDAGTYNVCVDGFSAASGNYVIDIHELSCDEVDCEGTPEGDDLANDGCNLDVPSFGEISCDETICGEVWSNDSLRDLDWYTFDLADAQEVTLTAEVDTFNPVIFLISDPAGDCNFTIVTSADLNSYCEGEEATALLTAGHYYAVIAHNAWDGLGGNYALTLTCEGWEPGEGEYCDTPIVADTWPYEVTGTTTDNVDSYGNPAPDEWYQFTAYAAATYTISLCGSEYDTYLWILDENCSVEVASNDDACGLQSEIVMDLDVGTYNVCVDGYSSNSGNFILTLSGDNAPPAGDTCEDPIVIDAFPFSDSQNTQQYNDVDFNSSPDVYYAFIVDEAGLYTFTTCYDELFDGYFDTYLRILAEDCETVVAENDDDCDEGAYSLWSTISEELAQGVYYLMVEGYTGESGVYMLDCYSAEGVTTTAPLEFALEQNYPNPFNPTTTINYSIAEPVSVNLTVFNVMGQEVATLVDRQQTPGIYSVQFDASQLSSGVYMYRLEAGDFTDLHKMILVK